MNTRLNPIYKKLLSLTLVLGPMIWLVMTDDGQRRSDLVLLYLFGKAEINLAIENLDGSMTEDEFRTRFPDLELSCDAGLNPFGDRLCSAELGSFNQIPSRAITLFLEGDRMRAVKVNYRRAYQEPLMRQLSGRLGMRGERTKAGAGAISWQVSDGLLLMPATAPKNDSEAALMWLSAAALQRRSEGGS